MSLFSYPPELEPLEIWVLAVSCEDVWYSKISNILPDSQSAQKIVCARVVPWFQESDEIKPFLQVPLGTKTLPN